MRSRIRDQRNSLATILTGMGLGHDFSFIVEHRGMFTYSGLSESAVEKLRDKFGIYLVRSGRICVAALNERNVGYVAEAIGSVIRDEIR
jgi:aromatic-amino-acid transaminase